MSFDRILQALQKQEKEGGLDRAMFSDIPIQVYHHPDCPGISSSQLKLIINRSFVHYQAKVDTQELRFGNAFHCYNNEPHLFNETYMVIATDNKRSGDWRSGKKVAAVNGKIPLSLGEFNLIKAMTDKIWKHPEARGFVEGAEYEKTFFARDPETGILMKCRVDCLKENVLSDLKSTENASKDSFFRDARKFGYDISAAYYLKVVSLVMDTYLNDFYLIACEKPEPNEIACYRVSNQTLVKAWNRIEDTLHRIKEIQESKTAWPGYQLGQELEL